VNPWDFFDGIFCINLRHRDDRLKKSVEEFKYAGIVGRVELLRVDKPDSNPHNFHSPGFWGNLTSHRQCIRSARQRGMRNALIFEDDVQFYESDIASDVAHIASELPEDWQLLYLGAIKVVRQCDPYSDHLLKINHGLGVHAVAVNGTFFDGAIRCLDLAEEFGRPVDSIYCDVVMKAGRSYLANPMIARQYDDYSDVWEMEREVEW